MTTSSKRSAVIYTGEICRIVLGMLLAAPCAAQAQRAGAGGAAAADSPTALTLDQAVARLERENLTLAAMRLEVPQARADIVTAEQEPDSFRFLGGGREGPLRVRRLDLVPKRWARAVVARLAAHVTEAQYQDAVRTRTACLFTAYVDLQEANTRVKCAQSALTGIELLMENTKNLVKLGAVRPTDLSRGAAMHSRAEASAADAKFARRKAALALASLLNMRDAEAEQLEVMSATDEDKTVLPTLEEVIPLALNHRPDLHAFRLGLLRAHADWLRVWFEQWPDLYIVTRGNRPGRHDAGNQAEQAARTFGLLVRTPDLVHYRGRLERAALNVAQSRIELADAERRVVLDVRQAYLECTAAMEGLKRLRRDALPRALEARNATFQGFKEGEIDLQAVRNAQVEYSQIVEDYMSAAIRDRRAVLALNTAVGKRVLPLSP